MSESPVVPKRFGIRFTPEISFGQFVQAALVASGLIVWGATQAARVDTTQRDLAELRVELAKQMAGMQVNMTDQFRGVRNDIAALPDVRAELTQLERRADQADNRMGALSDRVGQVFQQGIQTRADLDSLLRNAARTRDTPP